MILGVDPGERRIGIAVGDESTGVAVPVEVIDARTIDPVDRVAEIVAERGVKLVVVGLPVGLSGGEGPAVSAQQGFLESLTEKLDVPVTAYDERLTTVVAERAMRAAGGSAARRKQIRDAVAAQVMLQGYLDAHGGSR